MDSRQQKMKRLLKQNHVRNEREKVIALFGKYFDYKLRIEDFKSCKETNEHNRLLEEQVCYEEIFQLYNSFNSSEINKHLCGELSRSIRLSHKHLLIFYIARTYTRFRVCRPRYHQRERRCPVRYGDTIRS